MYAIVDCNNFFASCERLFRPELCGKPVIVLSNNDGCAISRSNEAKPYMPMGAPLFKYRSVVDKYKIQVFSANFQLYGDMSRRVMDVLSQLSPNVEQYSIDEAFVNLSEISVDDVQSWANTAAEQILKWTGIPVSIGVGPTKTVAKLAVEYAKSAGATNAVVFDNLQASSVQSMDIAEVWGIGRRLAPRLKQLGICRVVDLQKLELNWARQFAGLTFMNTIRELKGIDVFGVNIQFNEPSKKTISATRTFGHRVSRQSELESAVANFVTRASFRMRKNHKLARQIYIFAQLNGRNGQRPYVQTTVRLPVPTDHTGHLIRAAIDGLGQIFQSQATYRRAGLSLLGLVPRASKQLSLANPLSEQDLAREDKLMQMFDATRKRFGEAALGYAVTNNHHWQSLKAHKTLAYTTSWHQLATVS